MDTVTAAGNIGYFFDKYFQKISDKEDRTEKMKSILKKEEKMVTSIKKTDSRPIREYDSNGRYKMSYQKNSLDILV